LNLGQTHHRMHADELVTRSTAWVALTFYVAGEALCAVRRNPKDNAIAWWLKAVGGTFFLGHVAAAFHFFYDWSHAVAYADTARQSRAFSGLNSGGGLYLNYLFALVWVSDVVWWRIASDRSASPPAFWTWTVRLFFLFMIFNGAFVFVRGNVRWFGFLLCLILLVGWWFRVQVKRNTDWDASLKSS